MSEGIQPVEKQFEAEELSLVMKLWKGLSLDMTCWPPVTSTGDDWSIELYW